MTTRSLDRLPVALRPYPDETLSSWLSRTASVYGCTAQELLNSYHPFRQEPIDVIDLQPSDATLTSLHVLLGTQRAPSIPYRSRHHVALWEEVASQAIGELAGIDLVVLLLGAVSEYGQQSTVSRCKC